MMTEMKTLEYICIWIFICRGVIAAMTIM